MVVTNARLLKTAFATPSPVPLTANFLDFLDGVNAVRNVATDQKQRLAL
jgi:hypothetical protein